MNNKKNNKIEISLIQRLRNITGSGLIECKNALIDAQGNIDLAILNMRKSGIVKAIKKYKNITTNGIIATGIKGNIATILELNCQTDFLSENIEFKNFSKKIISNILDLKNTDIHVINKKFEIKKNILISKFSENINIRRVAILIGEQLGYYLHNNMKIGVIISTKNMKEDLIKKIAMHIAASKPEYLNVEDIPDEKILYEKQIQLEIAKKYKKNSFISKKIVEGKIKKFIHSISLINQIFIFDTQKTIKKILDETNSQVVSFVRFELGEGLEKNDSSFSQEVFNISNLYKKN